MRVIATFKGGPIGGEVREIEFQPISRKCKCGAKGFHTIIVRLR